eukprot:jgi/Ulvmu1/4318/UM002_0040.1
MTGTAMVTRCAYGTSITSVRSNLPSTQRSARRKAQSRRDVLTCISAATLLTATQQAQAAFVDEGTSVAVFQKVAASVVTVEDYTVVQGRETSDGVGSGFVWSKLGHVVTNYHCISKVIRDQTGKSSVRVTFDSGLENSKSYTATVVGTDPSRDLAVLHVEAEAAELFPVSLGTSQDLRVGQYVYAIGNPSGLSKTQTNGVVSGLNRSIPSPTGLRIPGAIQTDAAISAGNSGGPLVDSAGRLVGINTATFTKQGTGRSSGVNFALPVDMVAAAVPKLIVFGQAGDKRV